MFNQRVLMNRWTRYIFLICAQQLTNYNPGANPQSHSLISIDIISLRMLSYIVEIQCRSQVYGNSCIIYMLQWSLIRALNSYSCWVLFPVSDGFTLLCVCVCALFSKSIIFSFPQVNCIVLIQCIWMPDILDLQCYLIIRTSRLSHWPPLSMVLGLLAVNGFPSPHQILL